jgi:hypothetical protein
MAEPFSPGGEFIDVVDGLEPIVLRSRDGRQFVAIAQAKRSAISVAEADGSGGLCRRRDVRWHFPVSGLEFPPELGGGIEDNSGESWTILEISLAVGGSRWKCRARNLVIAEGLDERVTVQISDRSRAGQAGDRKPVWSDLLVGVPARIQPLSWEPRLIADQRRAAAMYNVYFAREWEVSPARNYRIVDAGGTVYRIDKIERAERIDVLPRAIAWRE